MNRLILIFLSLISLVFAIENEPKKDILKEIASLKEASLLGDIKAYIEIAKFYDSNELYKNELEAIRYYLLPAIEGDIYSQKRLTFLLSKKDNRKKFNDYFISMNTPEAFVELGLVYALIKDFNEAFYWYEKAAKKNSVDAILEMAFMYFSKLIPPSSIEKIIMYLEKIAVSDDQASFMLGEIYEFGEKGYVDIDIQKAEYYYKQAIDKNDDNIYALTNLAFIYLEKNKADSNKKLKEIINKLIEKNKPEGIFLLGLTYERGIEVPKDINKAIAFFKEAAEYNYVHAQVYLANYYKNINNSKEAREWLEKACLNHDNNSCNLLENDKENNHSINTQSGKITDK